MVSGLAALAVAMAFGAQARAQAAWPSRPLRLVLPFAAGSGTDIAARILAEELTRSLGQNVLVDNRPGASGQIAAEAVAKAPPDGYTLFLTTNTSHSANPHLFRKLSYDPVKDFTPVARTYLLPFMLVVDPKLPVRTVAELIAHARAAPAPISYGYGNSTGQVAGAALGTAATVPLLAVPYKSTPPAMTDVIGGTVQFMFVDLAAGRENVRAGRLRAIAVTTTKRSVLMPELPAVAETPGLESFDLTSWGGLFGPAGMPAEIVGQLSTEVIRILERKDVRERYGALGVEITTGGPDELARFVREQLDNWGRKIRDAGIRPE
jgi:tripartite-type tricarboxylate transporter receptor subunit TctC